jgi:hypothetical protein
MKIKIAKDVIFNGKILKKDEVHEVQDHHGKLLINGTHAFEHRESAPSKPTGKKEEPKEPTSGA